MNKNKNISTFIGCESEYCDSNIVLFGAPFDGTASYRSGSRFASAAIRSESMGIETYSPYQDKDLSDAAILDGGDLDVIIGNAQKTLDIIEEYTRGIIDDKKIPLMIGGEHLVTLGAVRAVKTFYPDLHVVHFDAHADLRDDYMGEKLSHATVMHRVWDIVGDGKIFQYGIRSGTREEFNFAATHTSMNKFNFNNLEKDIKKLADKPVYLTIDLDVLDTSVLPGTGTPEAGGVSFNELQDAVIKLAPLNIVACDITELAPTLDASGASTLTACKITRELLLML